MPLSSSKERSCASSFVGVDIVFSNERFFVEITGY